MKKTAILAVDKDWVNSGVCQLVNDGRLSTSTQTHLLIFPIEHEDEHGIWLADITTLRLRSDDKPVTMAKFLVPWRFIYGVGIVESNLPIGFEDGGQSSSAEP